MPHDSPPKADPAGLESLVVNTAYLKGQQAGRNEQRMRRESLTLPNPKKSTAPRAGAEKSYEWLCELQPIGRKLFLQFLMTSDPQRAAAAVFLQELDDWSFAEDATKEKVRQRILAKFCHPQSQTFLSYLTEDSNLCRTLSVKSLDEETVQKITNATKDFLKGKPFLEYLKSPHFYRFLQWKECERQKITDKYFYEFRTLGRGGFGEVRTQNFNIYKLNSCLGTEVCCKLSSFVQTKSKSTSFTIILERPTQAKFTLVAFSADGV